MFFWNSLAFSMSQWMLAIWSLVPLPFFKPRDGIMQINFNFIIPWIKRSLAKNLPAMQETQLWSLNQGDPLEKWMATHSSIPAWRISWTEEPDGLQYMGSQRVKHEWVTNTLLSTLKKIKSLVWITSNYSTVNVILTSIFHSSIQSFMPSFIFPFIDF